MRCDLKNQKQIMTIQNTIDLVITMKDKINTILAATLNMTNQNFMVMVILLMMEEHGGAGDEGGAFGHLGAG